MATTHMNYDFGLSNEHVRENPDGSLTVSGYASNYDADRVGDTVTRGALTKALEGYGKNPTVLYNHKWSLPAGRVTKARVDDQGLWVEANLPRPAADAPEMVRHYFNSVKNGTMRAWSIGGKWVRDARRRLVEIDLQEISIAAAGVNSTTLMSAQLGKAFGDPSDPRDDWGQQLAQAEARRMLREVRSDIAAVRLDAFLKG